jgi:hypothetical protein
MDVRRRSSWGRSRCSECAPTTSSRRCAGVISRGAPTRSRGPGGAGPDFKVRLAVWAWRARELLQASVSGLRSTYDRALTAQSVEERARPGILAASVIEPLAFARLPKNPYAAAQLQKQQLSAARTTRAASVAQSWHPCAEASWCKGEPAMTSPSTLGSRRRRQADASAKAPCDSCCKRSSWRWP